MTIDEATKFWLKIEKKVEKYCANRWNGYGEDVLSQTKVVFFEKAIEDKFEFRSSEKSTSYVIQIAKKVARDVVKNTGESLNSLIEKGFDLPEPGPSPEEGDEKIEFLQRYLRGPAAQVLFDVLKGEDLVAACSKSKISYKKFISQCKKILEHKDQLSFF